MRLRRAQLLSLGLVLAAFALAAALYGRLPDPVPTHWNARGQVDGFTPKPWGPFVVPLAMAGTYLLLLLVPRISPRGYRLEGFQRAFEVVQASILAFLLLVTALVLLVGTGVPLAIDQALTAGIGLLLAVLGNFMGKFTRNFFVGIRTPWTLASEEVWLRTHRLGGKVFVLAGAILFVSGLAGGGPLTLLAVTVAASLVPVVYSYVLYRRLEGFEGEGPGPGPGGPGGGA